MPNMRVILLSRRKIWVEVRNDSNFVWFQNLALLHFPRVRIVVASI